MHTPLLSIFVARRSFLIVVWAALLSSPAPAVHASGDPCIDNAVLGITPLTDMPPGSTYQGFPGGLYPDGNNPPDTWRAAALARAQTIRPLAADGTDDASNGRIVLLSVGMSNATQEYSNFVALAGADPRRDAHVLTVDGAQGGRDATDWIDPDAPTWDIAKAHLQDPAHGGASGISPAQVQAIWILQAIKNPRNLPGAQAGFPGYAQLLQSDLAAIARSRRPGC